MHEQFAESTDAPQALARLVEELGESVAAAGKLQRFGPHSVNPLLPVKDQVTNIRWLLAELDDVRAAGEKFVYHAKRAGWIE